MKWILAIVLLAVAAFCLFGFVATLEPGNWTAHRIGFALVGVACVAIAAYVILRQNPK